MKTEILILDYNRPNELINLAASLHENANFDKKIVVLNNGGNGETADALLSQGLVDKVIHNKVNVGCGLGTLQLFAQCESEFAFYVQVDHKLQTTLAEKHIEIFKDKISFEDYFYVDVAGDQGHGEYSERAQFIRKKDYLSASISAGGPGPLEDLKWSEESLQEHMKKNDLTFFSYYEPITEGHLFPPFADCGWSSVRENPDGSKWEHKPDTKVLKCLQPPTEIFTFPPLSEEEWETAIDGRWPDEGKIPQEWKDHSFEAWNKLPS